MKRESIRLAELEELVLLTIAVLGDRAYGTAIRDKLQQAGRTVSAASVYVTLGRLEAKKFIFSEQGESTAKRGGRAKTYYALTAIGQGALENAEAVRTCLRAGALDDAMPEDTPGHASTGSTVSSLQAARTTQSGRPLGKTENPAPQSPPTPISPPASASAPRRDYLNYYGE